MSHVRTHKTDKHILNTSSARWRTLLSNQMSSTDSSGWLMCVFSYNISCHILYLLSRMVSTACGSPQWNSVFGGSGCGRDPPCFLFNRRTGEGRVRCYCESCCLEGRFRISEVDDNENPASPPLSCSMNCCLSRCWNPFVSCFFLRDRLQDMLLL